MKVVFLEDVEGVAQGGEVKEVKPGCARNYLIPKQLAVIATHDSL
jgi:large subunit ribosomal protein L9